MVPLRLCIVAAYSTCGRAEAVITVTNFTRRSNVTPAFHATRESQSRGGDESGRSTIDASSL